MVFLMPYLPWKDLGKNEEYLDEAAKCPDEPERSESQFPLI